MLIKYEIRDEKMSFCILLCEFVSLQLIVSTSYPNQKEYKSIVVSVIQSLIFLGGNVCVKVERLLKAMLFNFYSLKI